MIFANVPVIQPPEQMADTWHHWEGVGSELLIVDNTPDSAWRDLAAEYGWSYAALGKNLGVCPSWNLARAWFLDHNPHDYECLFLFSSSVAWSDGLAVVMHDLNMASNWKGAQTQWGGHGYAYSARVLREIGTWDENLSPGYYGDTDYWYRMILAGIIGGPEAVPQIETNSPKPEDGRALRMVGLLSNTGASLDYYVAKWGGAPAHETFTTPFNSGLPTSWWSPAYRPGLEHVDAGRIEHR